ncbi:MAG TPA: UDP-glucose 4-epimerase GalE [Planctomycetaceae bacterium]|nr:UDP-glucose 4-epimerase GalE [Planctomycetaceae bacterium]HRE99375.1 UDP-glucose 4-epimerase GalE [Pirellulaceae bacterium]
MNILVVGGAGYIGSHMVKLLGAAGHRVVVFDNLSEGHRGAVTGAELVVGDLQDESLVAQVLESRSIEAVIHFAASALVGESVTNPAKYYGNNVVATYRLLEAMRSTGVSKLVFSSTCATYGQPDLVPIRETEKQAPVNPYGFTKLVIERMLDDYAAAYGLGFAALRYFNASGAAEDGTIGEDHVPESHLIPIVLQVALGQRDAVSVFGTDYPTPDGTCIRDYIHVDDLGAAHLAALERLTPAAGLKVNLGTGTGYSVLEVIETCRRVTGHPIPVTFGPRRAGDPAELVADPSLARQVLGWQARYRDLESIVRSAWRWHSAHPRGYDDRGPK